MKYITIAQFAKRHKINRIKLYWRIKSGEYEYGKDYKRRAREVLVVRDDLKV